MPQLKKKLEEQESKYSAELEAQATEFDATELNEARLNLRPGMDRSTISRIQAAYETQYSPFTMAEAKRDVSNMLDEHEEEPRDVRSGFAIISRSDLHPAQKKKTGISKTHGQHQI